MNGGSRRELLTPEVVGEFLATAVVWLVPALLLLPVYLLLVAISVLATEGALLELVVGAKGKVHSALGLLLLLAAIAGAVLLVMHGGGDGELWLDGGVTIALTAGIGGWLVHRELGRIAARRAADS